MDQKELDAKIAEINAANNKIISDYQAENDRKLKGLVTDAAFKDLQGGFEKRFNEVNLELAKLKIPQTQVADDKGPSEKMKDFRNWFQKSRELGLAAMASPEQKVLTIGESTHAGVLAPYEYVQEIIKGVTLFSPIRQVARVRQTSAYAAEFPTETAIGVATWVAESAAKTETTGLTYALTEIKTFEMKILYKATQKMLEDSAFNLEAEIAQAVGRGFGLLEGTSFYSGNGTTAPEGIITNATVLADINNFLTHDTLIFDDFIKTQYLLASPYVRNAAWLLNRSTLGTLIALKSATTNTYLIQPSLTQGQPAFILGSPIYEWADFPAYVAGTASQMVAAYGDFRAGYCVVDRVDIIIQRLIELYAADGMIGFLARKRVGGGVLLPEAIQLLGNSAT